MGIEEDLVGDPKMGRISEEHSCVLKCQELDETAEYLTFALCHLCKAGQDHDFDMCKEMYVKPESTIDILSTLEIGKKSFQNVQMLDSIYENSVSHDDEDVIDSSESEFSPSENSNVENSAEMSCFSRGRCSSAMWKNGTSDIYGKIFEKVQIGLPVSSIRQHNNLLCTISCDSDLKVALFLPNELAPHVESVFVNEDNTQLKHCKERDEKKVCQEHLSFPGKTSVPKNSPKQGKLNLEDDHSSSALLSEELAVETKVIQTRSGRKTRFTFFSQTLNDDEVKIFERSELHNEDVASPTKKIKVDPEAHNATSSKKKRGRPRKVSHNKFPQDCVMTKDDILDVQSYHPHQSSFIPLKKANSNSKMSSSKDPFLSFFKNHHKIRATQENEIVKIIREHKKEHANILEEICSIVEDLGNHHH